MHSQMLISAVLTAISIANITFGIYDAHPGIGYSSVDIRKGPDYPGFFTKRHILIPIDMWYSPSQVHTPLGEWQFVKDYGAIGVGKDPWIELQGDRGYAPGLDGVKTPKKVTVKRVMPYYYFASQPVKNPEKVYFIFPAMYAVTHIHGIPVPWDVSDIADLNVSEEPVQLSGYCESWSYCHWRVPNFDRFYYPRETWFDMAMGAWPEIVSELNITGMMDPKTKHIDYDELEKCN